MVTSGDPNGAGDGRPEDDATDQAAADRLVDTLLVGLWESEENRSLRIEAVLRRYDRSGCQSRVEPGSQSRVEPGSESLGETRGDPSDPGESVVRRRPEMAPGSNRRRWWAVSSAAAVAAVFGGWMLVGPSPARAALQRTLSSLDTPTTRQYEVCIDRPIGGERTMKLSVRSDDRFVLEMPFAPLQPAAIGADGDRRWVVLGEHRWATHDPDAEPPGPLMQRLLARQIYLNRILRQLPEVYDVELGTPEAIPGHPAVRTRPLTARLNADRPRLPDMIRVWPDPRTGVPMHVRMDVPTPLAWASRHLRLTFVGEPQVEDGFFAGRTFFEPTAGHDPDATDK